MKYSPRALGPELLKAARAFPALILTGPRRAGKTTLLRKLFPHASYVLLEDPDAIARFRADPRQFIAELETPVILAEVQNVPEIFGYIRARIDARSSRKGQWFLTGSQEAPLMRGVTESMAGRAAIFNLLPLSLQESDKVTLLRGGFPEALGRPATAAVWFRSYVQTYLERDVRSVASIRDLATFRRFLAVLATRCGQVINRADLAASIGLSAPTVAHWLGVLELTGQILLVPPFFENLGKRLIKSPKLHFVDAGLACHLLGIETATQLDRSPFLGALFEGFVASEILKAQIAKGRARSLYYFRDQQGLEVDFVVPLAESRLALVEAKASRSVRPDAAAPLLRLARAMERYEPVGFVVHRPTAADPASRALVPGVSALALRMLPSAMGL
jgi:predicted AAA+ superfamily ATPase